MSAKGRLQKLADGAYMAGMSCFVEGVTLIQKSAKLEQAARILTEAEAQTALDAYYGAAAQPTPATNTKGGTA